MATRKAKTVKTAKVVKMPTKAVVPHRMQFKVIEPDNRTKIINALIAAAANPKIDVAKMQQLVAIKTEMEDREAKIEFDNALADIQGELPQIDRRGRIVIRKKDPRTNERTGPVEQSTGYAKWEDINAIVQPILHKHHFSLSFRVDQDPAGRIMVTGILARGGHREQTSISLQHDSTGSKNAVQAVGSTVSYGKRYTGCLLLNIITRGEDDDGASFREAHLVSQEQLTELIALADETFADKGRFCALFGVASFAHIPALRFEEAKNQLLRKKRKRDRDRAQREQDPPTTPGFMPAESDFPGDKPLGKAHDG